MSYPKYLTIGRRDADLSRLHTSEACMKKSAAIQRIFNLNIAIIFPLGISMAGGEDTPTPGLADQVGSSLRSTSSGTIC